MALQHQIQLLKEEVSVLKRQNVSTSLTFSPKVIEKARQEHENDYDYIPVDENKILRVSSKQVCNSQFTTVLTLLWCLSCHAQGRTHPVTTYFLEDIHEKIDYRLASDSPASLRSDAPKQKVHPLEKKLEDNKGQKSTLCAGEALKYIVHQQLIQDKFGKHQ